MNAHEQLLRRWASRAQRGLVLDGIFDEGRWSSASIRILFVLKDAYDSDNPDDGWDLREYAKQEGNKGVTLREMSYWAHTLLNPDSNHPCGDGRALHNALLSTALINVKKIPGATYSSNKEIVEHANDYGDLLLEQIDIISPDLVVCGSTWWAIKDIVKNATTGTSFDRIYKMQEGRVFLDFWHPANRFPRLMNCATLTELGRRSQVLPNS